MDIEDFMNEMFYLGVDGVELLDMHLTADSDSLKKLKLLTLDLGIDVAAVTIHPSYKFTSISPRRQEPISDPVKKIKKWIDIASYMGAPVLRVDVIHMPGGTPEEEVIEMNVKCIRECLPRAIEKGIVMGIENHGGVVSTADNILKIVNGVDSEWYGVVLDFGNFGLGEEAYKEMEKVAPYVIFCHAKTYEFGLGWLGLDSFWEEKRIDYRRVMDILRRNNYNGYLSLEYEGEEPEETAVPKGIDFLGRLVLGSV